MKNGSPQIAGTLVSIIALVATATGTIGDGDTRLKTGQTHNASMAAPSRSTVQPHPLIDLPLWHNGDSNGQFLAYRNGLVFGCQVAQSASSIYDDFNVSSPNGWKVTSVFINQFFDTTNCLGILLDIAGATWEIRQGVSDGNGGTLIASGFSYSPTVTDLGVSGGGCAEEYQVLITGLDVSLAPGTYWLNVTPIGEGSQEPPVTTNGANCVGSPCGNDQNSFVYDTYDNNLWGAAGVDFSMGINGVSCPGNCFDKLILVDSVKFLLSGQQEKIPLPLTGESGVEDRSGKPGGNFTVEMTFTNNIISFARASSSCGRVASTSVNGSTLTVNLTGVSCNASNVTVTANDVKDDAGNDVASACATIGLLLGDVDGNRVVDSNDLTIVRSQLNQPTNDTNLRSDINNDGIISNADLQMVTRQIGTRLP